MNKRQYLKEDQLIAYCSECETNSIFEINEDQDSFDIDGTRLRECIKCGRYEEKEESE